MNHRNNHKNKNNRNRRMETVYTTELSANKHHLQKTQFFFRIQDRYVHKVLVHIPYVTADYVRDEDTEVNNQRFFELT